MPETDNWRTDHTRWQQTCYARMLRGEVEYGNRSFDRSVPATMKEIAEELEDIANWAFIAWRRVVAMARQASD